jgi:DNA repair ATPase RecN
MLFRRVTAILMLALGLPGLASCVAGGYAVWKAEARLQRANDRAFALIDQGLGSVEDRVRRTKQRVEQSRITTNEITQGLREWATREAKDRLVVQLDIEARMEKLTDQLHDADLWLEASTDSVRDLQQALELSRSLGAEVDPASLEEALETLVGIRGRLQEAEQSVDEIRGFATAVGGESDENRVARVLKLLARVVVTMTEIAPRLDRLAARISGTRADAQEGKTRTSSYILWTAIGCTVTLAWIAAGQLALCVWGLNRWRRVRSPVGPTVG